MGVDSLAAVKLQSIVKQKYKVEIPLNLLFQSEATVSNLAQIIESKQGITIFRENYSFLEFSLTFLDLENEEIDFSKEILLDDLVQVDPAISPLHPDQLSHPKAILLTGATVPYVSVFTSRDFLVRFCFASYGKSMEKIRLCIVWYVQQVRRKVRKEYGKM